VTSWQIPGVPQVPMLGDVTRTLQAQAELLADLPGTLADIQQATQGLAETIELSKSTVVTAHSVIERLDRLVTGLDEPVRRLTATIERVNDVLAAPVIERLPALLESVEETVQPVARSAATARARWARLFWWRRRRRQDSRGPTPRTTEQPGTPTT
jgi:hypothetical protein